MSVFDIFPVPQSGIERKDIYMSIAPLGQFPNTIGNLPDRPNLGPAQMKEKLQADLRTLWPYVQQLINDVNGITGFATLPLSVENGGTHANNKADARTNLGFHVGDQSPTSVAASLSVGDLYVYVPDLNE